MSASALRDVVLWRSAGELQDVEALPGVVRVLPLPHHPHPLRLGPRVLGNVIVQRVHDHVALPSPAIQIY